MNLTTLIPNYHEQPTAPPAMPLVERFLREREGIWRQIYQEYRLNELIRHMLLNSAVALAGYGAVIGIFQSPLQALAAAAKLPLLYLLTLAICLPTLYLFNLLCQGRMSVRQVLALALAAITVMSGLTLAFAPITLFFLITANGYQFFVLFNVAILALTGLIGLKFLVSGTRAMNRLSQAEQAARQSDTDSTTAEGLPSLESLLQTEPANARKQASQATPSANMTLLWVWLLLFAFVGTQLGWTLRPFVGMPDEAFVLFRSIEGDFYSAVLHSILHILTSL